MTNAYPEKPLLPYIKTSISMDDVIAYIQSLSLPVAVKIAAYVMWRNESANGQKGINNNYIGAQCDGNRWAEKWNTQIEGVVSKKENATGKTRLFLAFYTWKTSVDFLCDRVQGRGLYVGGYAGKIAKMNIHNSSDWANAYFKEWVTGSATALPDTETLNGLLSMYRQGVLKFS